MAFVNEFVPEDQKKLLKADARFNKPWGGALELYRWVIDHERGVFLVYVCGGMPSLGDNYVDPDHYAMRWKDYVIKFDATVVAKGNRKDGATVDWTVMNICIPDALREKREIVLELIRDGLDAMGTSSCDRDGVIAVNVHFK